MIIIITIIIIIVNSIDSTNSEKLRYILTLSQLSLQYITCIYPLISCKHMIKNKDSSNHDSLR